MRAVATLRAAPLRGPTSVRATVVAVTAVLVLLPFALLGIAWGYERVLVASVADELRGASVVGAFS